MTSLSSVLMLLDGMRFQPAFRAFERVPRLRLGVRPCRVERREAAGASFVDDLVLVLGQLCEGAVILPAGALGAANLALQKARAGVAVPGDGIAFLAAHY